MNLLLTKKKVQQCKIRRDLIQIRLDLQPFFPRKIIKFRNSEEKKGKFFVTIYLVSLLENACCAGYLPYQLKVADLQIFLSLLLPNIQTMKLRFHKKSNVFVDVNGSMPHRVKNRYPCMFSLCLTPTNSLSPFFRMAGVNETQLKPQFSSSNCKRVSICSLTFT